MSYLKNKRGDSQTTFYAGLCNIKQEPQSYYVHCCQETLILSFCTRSKNVEKSLWSSQP